MGSPALVDRPPALSLGVKTFLKIAGVIEGVELRLQLGQRHRLRAHLNETKAEYSLIQHQHQKRNRIVLRAPSFPTSGKKVRGATRALGSRL
jgi:hypothetical protein